MSLFNPDTKALELKLVYWGPEGSGKTTTVDTIAREAIGRPAQVLAIGAPGESARADCEYVAFPLGVIGGATTTLHIYTAPGAASLASERARVVGQLDGVVFVADSRPGRQEANRASLDELRSLLAAQGLVADRVPVIVQYNRRDADDALSLDVLRGELNARRHPEVETVATDRAQVMVGLREAARAILTALRQGA